MPKASALEKVVVNLFTPIDLIRDGMKATSDRIRFIPFHFYSSGRKILPAEEKWQSSYFTYKIRAYERLLRLLQVTYDERTIGAYMHSPCGRIDVLLAMRRGLLNTKQYAELSQKYPIAWR